MALGMRAPVLRSPGCEHTCSTTRLETTALYHQALLCTYKQADGRQRVAQSREYGVIC